MMADLYVIIKATQHLEKAYIRDNITSDEYTQSCERLIAQFKTTEAALQNNNFFSNTKEFVGKYKMGCALAVERLLTAGVPATVMHAHSDMGQGEAAIVAQVTQYFITAMDTLKLDQRAIDEIQPIMKDLMSMLGKATKTTKNMDLSTLQGWLVKLNQMRAAEELDEEEARQLQFELDAAYHNFVTALQQT